jgi:predicted Zn-dependent protease
MMKRKFEKMLAGLCLGFLTAGFGADQAQAFPDSSTDLAPTEIRVQSYRLADNSGGTYLYQAGGVKFTVPEGWRDEKQANGTVLVGPKDGNLVVMVWAPDQQDISRAAEIVDAVLAKFVSDVEVEEVEDIKESNGMRTLCVTGYGTASQKDCSFTAQFVQGTRLVVFLAVADSDTLEQHEDALAELDDSITRI